MNTNQRRCASLFVLLGVVVCPVSLPSFVCADQLRLKASEQGAEVEVLEERPDAFIVKIPKGEVELITREAPTDVKLWKEKKILWEDQGDYLVISLPKERIAPPPTTTTDTSAGYAAAPTLTEGVAATGKHGHASALGLLTGDVTGRVLRHGKPVAGCRVKLSPIPGPASELTRLLGNQSADPRGQRIAETTTGRDGTYHFEGVPIGDYDISWLPPDSTHWLGWLSDKPDVTVRAGEVTQQGDLKL